MIEMFWPVLAMLLLAALFIVWPLFRHQRSRSQQRQQWNLQLFEQRLQELSEEHQRGLYSDSEYHALRNEQQRQLLEDADKSASPVQSTGRRSIGLAFALTALLVLGGSLLYRQVGAWPDWQIQQTLQQLQSQSLARTERQQLLQQLQAQLEARLENRPDNVEYLLIAGQLLIEQQRYPQAVEYFNRLYALSPESPQAIAQLVQARFLAEQRVLSAELRALADRGLALQPQQPTLLGLLGMASYEQGDYNAALQYWRQLLPLLTPQSREYRLISAGIEEANKALGTPVAESAAAVETGRSITVQLQLDPALQAAADDRVFVFARAIDGPPMPLAVAVLTVADLPTSVTLSDQQSMTPALKLSDVEQIRIVARVAKGGNATASSGDLEGSSEALPNRGDVAVQSVSLRIDRVVP